MPARIVVFCGGVYEAVEPRGIGSGGGVGRSDWER